MIFRKIIKIVATRCEILKLKYTKSAPDPAGGAYSAPPDPLAGFKGPTSKGREGKGEREGKPGIRKKVRRGRDKGKAEEGDRDGKETLEAQGKGREGKGVGKRGGEGKFRGPGPPNVFS